MTAQNEPLKMEEDVLEILKMLDPHELSDYIGSEHPQIIAFLLTMVEDPQKIADTLTLLSESLKSDVLYRIATMRYVSKEVVRTTLRILAMELKSFPQQGGKKLGGADVCAQILQIIPKKESQALIQAFEQQDPTLAATLLKNKEI